VIAYSPSLLITDDNRDFRETMGVLFMRRGFRTVLAEDGQQAVEIVDCQTVHLILLDVDMPRLGGFETLDVIKRKFESLPCILMSARYDSQMANRALEAKAFAVHPKPIALDKMFADVLRALHQFYGWTLSKDT
jgi:DNA-binding NtrC family response regulator